MRLTYLQHCQQDNRYRKVGLACHLYVYISVRLTKRFYDQPAGTIGSLLADYSNHLWVLFLSATIPKIFLVSVGLSSSDQLHYVSGCQSGRSAWYLRFRHDTSTTAQFRCRYTIYTQSLQILENISLIISIAK